MKKSEMKEFARKAIETKTLCCVEFKYDYYYLHHFPIKMSDRLFLGAKHDDFLLDGFEIRRLAIENNVTMFTALDTVRVLLDVLEEITLTISTIDA